MTARIETLFETMYTRAPHWVVRSPGRVNLIGEFTDYNDGFVLPMAIERYVEIAAAPNTRNRISVYSLEMDATLHIDSTQPIVPDAAGAWTNYPKGVLAGFQALGRALPGFDVLVRSSVPIGGGLSSSAALEVGLATLLESMCGVPLDPLRKALLCHQAEHDFAGVPCGIMDQFVCAMNRVDHFMLLDCRSQHVDWIEFADPSVSILIVDTRVKHELASSEYAVRRRQCETAAEALGVTALRDVTEVQLQDQQDTIDPIIFRRARHVVTENTRTVAAAACIRQQLWSDLGQLMYQSHASLQKDFQVSCAELDTVVDIAREIGIEGGILGCRMTGGGFGGCAVALIKTDVQDSIIREMTTAYEVRTGIKPRLFVSRPAAGASLQSSTITDPALDELTPSHSLR